MTEPFFSVIIPVYNRAHALRRAIESVRAQSCQDFEIVVVDDGSHDDPGAVVASFNDPRTRFYVQANGGGGKARNTAIDHARGRFIAPLDHLASMKALLDNSTGLVGYAQVQVDRGVGRIFLKPPRAIRDGEDMATYLLCDRGFVPTITTVVPRVAAVRIRYDENMRRAEDTDFAIRLFLAGYRFHMLAQPGAVWQDGFDPGRTSAIGGGEKLGAWLSRMRPHIPEGAWHGGRGWAYAKLIVSKQPLLALSLYLNAVLRGCYRPSQAGIIFLQIFLGRTGYRHLADHIIAWLHIGNGIPEDESVADRVTAAQPTSQSPTSF
jgi:hypothetical protein